MCGVVQGVVGMPQSVGLRQMIVKERLACMFALLTTVQPATYQWFRCSLGTHSTFSLCRVNVAAVMVATILKLTGVDGEAD